MVIDTSKLKISTKAMVSAFLSFGALMQIPEVSSFVVAVTQHHPRIASLATTVTAVYALLHNPQVQDALGIKTTVKVEEVQLSEPKA